MFYRQLNKNLKAALSFLPFLFPFSGQAQKSISELLSRYNEHSVPYISVEELRMLQLDGKVFILDAREKREFQVSHIPSAKFVGYSDFSVEELLQEIPDKGKSIVVYCSVGIRSEKIGEKLQKAGFQNVRNLYGGIFAWKNKGYPILNPSGKETDSIHVYSKYWGQWSKKGIPVYE